MKRDNILTENYCNECDEVLHQVFDYNDFYAHKVGALICPNCGHVTMPCNECENHNACGHCPWAKAEKSNTMSAEAYMRYLKSYEPRLYKIFKDGENGDYYAEIIKKIEEV